MILEMPILRTTYDTFTVATMINRALSDQLIKKDIMLVSDIYMPAEKTHYLAANRYDRRLSKTIRGNAPFTISSREPPSCA